ncbi:MAG: hypothetical protein J6A99_01740 [Clostridia bacterium]|nr:hypothetical protein [Clostridia bacterium]
MKYKVYCTVTTPKQRTIMKVIDVSADTDADAIKRAEEKFNKYLSRVGYKVKIVMFEPIFA